MASSGISFGDSMVGINNVLYEKNIRNNTADGLGAWGLSGRSFVGWNFATDSLTGDFKKGTSDINNFDNYSLMGAVGGAAIAGVGLVGRASLGMSDVSSMALGGATVNVGRGFTDNWRNNPKGAFNGSSWDEAKDYFKSGQWTLDALVGGGFGTTAGV